MGRPTNKLHVKKLERQLDKISRRLDKVDVNTAEEDKLRWEFNDIEHKLENLDKEYPTGRKLFPN